MQPLWHLQPTRLTARGYTAGGTYEGRDEFQVIAQVDLRSDGTAFVHATMSKDGQPITPAMWRALVRELRDIGVKALEWEHKGMQARVDTDRA